MILSLSDVAPGARILRRYCRVAGYCRGPGRRAERREKARITAKGNGAERPQFPITAGRKPTNQWRPKNRRTSGECASGEWGRRRLLFGNLYGYFRAAEGKVPLLMVCVKRKPLHLVFYLKLRESRALIPRFHLWRIAGSRVGHGFERQPGRTGRPCGTTRPGRSGGRCTCHKKRLRRGEAGHKARRWCNFGGWVWEGWKTGREFSRNGKGVASQKSLIR